jgi:hypothetical protein
LGNAWVSKQGLCWRDLWLLNERKNLSENKKGFVKHGLSFHKTKREKKPADFEAMLYLPRTSKVELDQAFEELRATTCNRKRMAHFGQVHHEA